MKPPIKPLLENYFCAAKIKKSSDKFLFLVSDADLYVHIISVGFRAICLENEVDVEEFISRMEVYLCRGTQQADYIYVLEYATQLNVDDKMVAKEDFIFTSDLKSLSGAVLQKMVFAFKVAFLKVIEESMDTKLFIVLDSPKGKELDDDNMKLIENLVSTELCDNQIFFASIYDLEHEKLIEIKNRAIEGRNN